MFVPRRGFAVLGRIPIRRVRAQGPLNHPDRSVPKLEKEGDVLGKKKLDTAPSRLMVQDSGTDYQREYYRKNREQILEKQRQSRMLKIVKRAFPFVHLHA